MCASGSKTDPKWMPKRCKIEFGRKCDFCYHSNTDSMVLASGTPPKSIERRVKKASENRSPKKAFIFGFWALPEGDRSRKVAQKGLRGSPRGPQGRPKPLEIAPERISKYALYPKWAPRSSDGLRRRLLEGFRIHFGYIFERFWVDFFDNVLRNV